MSGQHAGDHIARLDDDFEAFARLEGCRRGPDLGVEGDRDAGFEELLAVVPVPGLPRRGAPLVQGLGHAKLWLWLGARGSDDVP
ncbi:hypothetical protein QWJ26_19200 [Streptomyces sp. CSDS2]|uniref:hypothetical protein n=1 Tax=Streptomyces sp. CSDS2 TaxID=3055051 RepID=UPI0025B1A05B|nr:hypothetical protein [Streptomyces sp. CSDS2]MDN3261901.1 hypothetical protein [Streptomyces sp. CSDS2]